MKYFEIYYVVEFFEEETGIVDFGTREEDQKFGRTFWNLHNRQALILPQKSCLDVHHL